MTRGLLKVLRSDPPNPEVPLWRNRQSEFRQIAPLAMGQAVPAFLTPHLVDASL